MLDLYTDKIPECVIIFAIVSLQYNTDRKKLEEIGKEEDVETINRIALRMAREIATTTGTLMAGGVCGTKQFKTDDREAEANVRQLFTEQV